MLDFLKNVAGNAAWFLLVVAGGALLARLSTTDTKRRDVAKAFLLGSALVSLIIVPFVLLSRLPQAPPRITVDNVESAVRRWLDGFGQPVQRRTDANTYFTILTTLNNETPIAVSRSRALD